MENGEPSFVVLGYDSYKGLLSDRPAAEVDIPLRRGDESQENKMGLSSTSGQFRERIGEKEAELLERINKQILSIKDEIEKEEKSTDAVSVDR